MSGSPRQGLTQLPRQDPPCSLRMLPACCAPSTTVHVPQGLQPDFLPAFPALGLVPAFPDSELVLVFPGLELVQVRGLLGLGRNCPLSSEEGDPCSCPHIPSSLTRGLVVSPPLGSPEPSEMTG